MQKFVIRKTYKENKKWEEKEILVNKINQIN